MSADEYSCGHDAGDPGTDTTSARSVRFPTDGELRALFVFAKFPDGDDGVPCDTTVAGGWPIGSQLPAWADSVIEDTTSPSIVGSITHFYDVMSGGAHTIRGTVFPSVVTASNSIAYYDTNYGCPTSGSCPALAHANHDVVLQVVDALGDDLLEYDLNEDGYLDYLFIYWRSPRNASGDQIHGGNFSGKSELFSGASLDSTYTLPSGTITIDRQAGASLFWRTYKPGTETIRIIDRWQVLAIAAHEYGHDVLGNGFHMGAMGPFSLMDGSVPRAERGRRSIVTGYNRLLNGWIDPVVLDSTVTGADTTIVLRDAATQGSAGYAVIQTPRGAFYNGLSIGQFFVLECWNSALSPYLDEHSGLACPIERNHSGLLVTHVLSGGAENWFQTENDSVPTCDPEIAEGMFDSQGRIDPELGVEEMQVYPGDTPDGLFPVGSKPLFCGGPADSGYSNLFGPFTNPSSNLYADTIDGGGYRRLARQDIPSGITIYDVKWANPGHDSMYVSIRFEGSDSTAGPDTIRGDMTWDGQVQLRRDLVVGPGATLILTRNARVVASALTDESASGDAARFELTSLGRIVATGDSTDPVEFTSSRDTAFEHFRGPGEPGTSAAPGDWFWIALRGETDSTLSSLSYVDMDYPTFAVSVDSIGGTLFRNHTENAYADVYVGSDVRIPAGSTWDFEAPARIWISNVDQAHAGEDTAHVEIGVDGEFRTLRPAGAASTDSVWIERVGGSGSAGDWDGITVRWDPGAQGIFRDASIAHAADPLTFIAADSAIVENSSIRAYSGVGIFDWSSNALIRGNYVDGSPGAMVSDDGAQIGIKALQSIPEVCSNVVGWHQKYGIEVQFGKDYCATLEDSSGAPEDSVLVEGNVVTGRGEDSGVFMSGSGIRVDWGCRKRHVRIYENEVRDWADQGVDLLQCADTRLGCNLVEDNNRGVQHSRNISQTEGGAVRLRNNWLLDSHDTNLWADDFSKLTLNDGGIFASWNEMAPESTSTQVRFNITHQDYTAAILDAEGTSWVSGSGALLAEADSVYVRSRITGIDTTLVDITTFSPYDLECYSQSAGSPRVEQFTDDVDGAMGLEGVGEPTRWDLLAVRREGACEIRWSVPSDRATISISIYDVGGRRVADLLRHQTFARGRYGGEWRYRNNQGSAVSAGVYFLRLACTDGTVLTEKVLVIR
ncbi:MAG: hypothetical protein KC591_04835 [Gemmatimonadetes bacterium]|nr:hypothetical protein [Gemmatimonadota bacterium]